MVSQPSSSGIEVPLRLRVLGMCKYSTNRKFWQGSTLAERHGMSPRALVYSAVVAVVLAVPGVASALTVTVSVTPKDTSVTPATVQGGAVVSATCSGTLGGMANPETFTSGTATVSGGTFAGGATTVPLTSIGPTTLSVTVATSGTLSVTCDVWASGYLGPVERIATDTSPITPPPVQNPVFALFSVPTGPVLVGTVNDVSALAGDPLGGSVTYAWSATPAGCGTFLDSSAASTKWTAPATQGNCVLTVTARNSVGSAIRTTSVPVALSLYQDRLSAQLQAPKRVAEAGNGDLLVIDGSGALSLLTKVGGKRGSIPGLGATAVTASGNTAFVATTSRGILKFDIATGRILGAIPRRNASAVTGLAYDATRDLLWLSLLQANRAIALRADGTQAQEITVAEGRSLRNLADVALDAASDTLWILERSGDTGQRVHLYSAGTLAYLRSMVTAGSSAGQIVTGAGLALNGQGRVFVSDSYTNVVQVLDASSGAALGKIGAMSDVDQPGNLLNLGGIAFMVNGDLAVANGYFNRVDRFGTGAALPDCSLQTPKDSDCDGLPDDWELKYGLNPNDPSDALADPDGDGLNNREEFALGTNPKNADTDGDGFSDRAEMLAGYDPLNPNDHRPALTASNLGTVPPGLVRLNAVSTNAANCSASWRQTSGAKVALRDADTFTPSFIARAAGTYRFEAVAVCGSGSSSPAVTEVQVANVSPLADAGRLVVTAPGRTVALNAGFSTDANGDALTYAWDQLSGAPTTVASRGAGLTVRPMQPGYYAYELTAADSAANQGKTIVGVVVADASLPTAIVAAPVVTAAAGGSVTLDASASLPADASFSWQQLEGASVGAIAASATPSVTPPNAGRYVFEVVATKNGVSSPPAQVMVLASAPVAAATAPATAAVNSAITLDGSTSAGAAAWAWRQVAGPAAGLAGADAAVATAVPFAAGVYVFELTVADASGVVSAPVTVRIDVAAAGKSLPVARAVAPATANAGDLVVLNGRTSTGAARYRWTQVRGPWVAIDGTSAAPVFTAPAAGTYGFELVVDDGTVRSAPASVTVNVQ